MSRVPRSGVRAGCVEDHNPAIEGGMNRGDGPAFEIRCHLMPGALQVDERPRGRADRDREDFTIAKLARSRIRGELAYGGCWSHGVEVMRRRFPKFGLLLAS